MLKKKQCKLLPHTRKDIYGLSVGSSQFHSWPIDKFSVPQQWRHSQGEGVTVAVIDTGCDLNHEDIKDNIIDGYNFINPGQLPQDDNGHGTHVAGTIAAVNNGVGMVGVAPQAKIMPIKALGADGSGINKNVAEAIVWAADHGADLITMSLGSEYPSIQIEKAIEYAKYKNVIIFCAAGNSGIESGIQYPAKYDNTISVGAIDEKLNICTFSCCGEELDFLAPGADIISAVPGNAYASMSGTSMATPFAVGCAALFLSFAKKIKFAMLENMLKSSDDYVSVFAKKAMKLHQQNYTGIKKYEGYGIIRPIL